MWARLHPPSFDRWAAPWLRRYWRRWTVYRGRRWAAVLVDCDLVRDNRRTGQLMVPRVLRVRSRTRSIDTLYVRMARGQDLHTWTEKADALAAALFAHRVAISKVRPAVLAVVVEREMPFGHVVPAPDIPGDPREVDLAALDVGDDEHGNPFRLGLLGKHVFIAGASGAGKGSLLWAPLRAIGPMIPAGLVRVSMIDLKGGAETARGRALFARYATTMADALDLLTEVRDAMKARQEHLRRSRTRKLAVSTAVAVGAGDGRRDGHAHRLRRPRRRPRSPAPAGGDPDPGPGLPGLGDRVRAGAVQGHRRRPGAVHHPHLPGRHRRLPRGHGARATAPANGARWPTRSPATRRTRGSGSSSTRARGCRCGSGPPTSPTTRSTNSSPAAPPGPDPGT